MWTVLGREWSDPFPPPTTPQRIQAKVDAAAGTDETPPDSGRPKHELVLEGGVAFGTGEHPTTRCCLEWLRRTLGEGEPSSLRLLDYGAGSGILGLGGLMFGAAEAVGVEVDRDAIQASHRNALANGLGDSFRCYLPPGEREGGWGGPCAAA